MAALAVAVALAGLATTGVLLVVKGSDPLLAQPVATSSRTGSATTTAATPVPSRTGSSSPSRSAAPTASATTSGPTPTRATPSRTTTQPPKRPAATPKPSPPRTVPAGPSSPAQEVLRLTNVERARAGCAALRWNATLASAAQAHSTDMRDKGYFSHTNLDGRSPFDRITAAGYSYRLAAENIAAGQPTPAAVLASWMNSSGHRANILNCALKDLGVGYAKGGSYGSYWTQDFAAP